MKNSIAIIGGNGFIGKNMVNYFSDKNYNVVVLDHSVDHLNENSKIRNFSVDIHHTKEVLEAVKDCNYVVWLVHASVPSTLDDSMVDDFSLNISPIVKFLEKSDQLPLLKKFVYLSSGGTVYGDIEDQIPAKETHLLKPISNYGLSKSTAEKYIEYLTINKNFETVILRPSNVYGPYQNLIKPQGIIGFAFKAIKNNLTLDLYDNGRVIRDFIYVKDLAKAVEMFFNNNVQIGNTTFYNVGSGEGFSIKQILDKIEIITEKKLQINHRSSRNFDCEYNVLDISKLKNETNWTAETTIDEGLEKVWEWIKSDI